MSKDMACMACGAKDTPLFDGYCSLDCKPDTPKHEVCVTCGATGTQLFNGYCSLDCKEEGTPKHMACLTCGTKRMRLFHGYCSLDCTPDAAHGTNASIIEPPTLEEQHDFCDVAKKRNFTQMRELVLQRPSLINCLPDGRWTALHQAACAGDVETVRFLLARGASVMLRTRDGRTPLDVAAPNVVEFLFEATPAFPDVRASESAQPTGCTREESIAATSMWTFTGTADEENDNNECQICLEKFAIGDELRTLNCSHFFHTKCVDSWLRNRSNSCPACRSEVV